MLKSPIAVMGVLLVSSLALADGRGAAAIKVSTFSRFTASGSGARRVDHLNITLRGKDAQKIVDRLVTSGHKNGVTNQTVERKGLLFRSTRYDANGSPAAIDNVQEQLRHELVRTLRAPDHVARPRG